MSNKSSKEFTIQTLIDGTGESVNFLTESIGLGRIRFIDENKNSPGKSPQNRRQSPSLKQSPRPRRSPRQSQSPRQSPRQSPSPRPRRSPRQSQPSPKKSTRRRVMSYIKKRFVSKKPESSIKKPEGSIKKRESSIKKPESSIKNSESSIKNPSLDKNAMENISDKKDEIFNQLIINRAMVLSQELPNYISNRREKKLYIFNLLQPTGIEWELKFKDLDEIITLFKRIIELFTTACNIPFVCFPKTKKLLRALKNNYTIYNDHKNDIKNIEDLILNIYKLINRVALENATSANDKYVFLNKCRLIIEKIDIRTVINKNDIKGGNLIKKKGHKKKGIKKGLKKKDLKKA